jgi:hypothetical protein
MNLSRDEFLDQLAVAIDSGDGRARAILPMFRHLLAELERDAAAGRLPPDGPGRIAHTFARRLATEPSYSSAAG